MLARDTHTHTHTHQISDKRKHRWKHGYVILLLSDFCGFVFSCHPSFLAIHLSLNSLGLCLFVYGVPTSVSSPKLVARHVWRIDWFDFHKMKAWQEDKSPLVSVSEQMEASPPLCLSPK